MTSTRSINETKEQFFKLKIKKKAYNISEMKHNFNFISFTVVH